MNGLKKFLGNVSFIVGVGLVAMFVNHSSYLECLFTFLPGAMLLLFYDWTGGH